MSSAPRAAKTERSSSAGAMADEACITDPGYWTVTRFGICMTGLEITYTLEEADGVVDGTGVLSVASSMVLNRTSATWNEEITVELTSTTGQVGTLNVAFDASCTSNCSMTDAKPWDGEITLSVGESASGAVTYTDALGNGHPLRDTLKANYHMRVTQDGAIPTQPDVAWENPYSVRCDAGFTTSGCVVPSVRPELQLPISRYGAAAVTYAWAQNNLPDSWGYRTPLRHLANDGAAGNNRERTCGSASSDPFVPVDEVTDDSCDEFPFASTYEGGTNGALCADIIPQLENGTWYIYEDPDKPVTYDEPCVRGHVPNSVNKSAGGAIGSFYKNQRVLDLEKFNLWISA